MCALRSNRIFNAIAYGLTVSMTRMIGVSLEVARRLDLIRMERPMAQRFDGLDFGEIADALAEAI